MASDLLPVIRSWQFMVHTNADFTGFKQPLTVGISDVCRWLQCRKSGFSCSEENPTQPPMESNSKAKIFSHCGTKNLFVMLSVVFGF